MSSSGECIDNPRLISKGGAILRSLTPPRIATLLLIREGIETQREIAKRLDRAPPTISNYIETLEDLPTPLVSKEGHNCCTTSEGNQVASAVLRCTTNYLGTDMQSALWEGKATCQLSQLDECLSPLHTFRSDPPFFILYALAIEGSSGWMADFSSEPVSVDNIVSAVKEWLDDSITRKQIRSRLRRFEDATTVEIDGQEATLTEKGLEQCRLLDQVMQLFVDGDNTENGIEDDCSIENKRNIIYSDSYTAMYCTGEKPVLSLPSSLTVGELVRLAANVGHEHDDDMDLDLKLVSEEQHNPVVED